MFNRDRTQTRMSAWRPALSYPVARHAAFMLGFAVIAVPACEASAAETLVAATSRPPSVTVVTAERGELVETVSLTGTLVPREEAVVNARIDGLAITEILVEEGDTVARDQVLARLSRDSLDATVAQNAAQIDHAAAFIAQASSQITEAQAASVQADSAFARTRDLVKTGAASRETFDQRQANAQGAQARLAEAESALKLAEADRALAIAQRTELMVRLARTDLRAPVEGLVSRRTARLGAVVSMSGEPLFRIIASGAIELEADVPEILLAKLRPGQATHIEVAGGEQGDGHVRLVSPEVSRTSRLGRIRIAIDTGAGLTIGTFARGQVEVARHDGVLVPLSAVFFQADGPRVQAVANGVVETRAVTIGLRADRRAEIRDGLRAGEQVVAVSGTFVRDGDRVTAVPAGAR